MASLNARQADATTGLPPGVTPNYINPVWRGRGVLISNLTLGALAIVVVASRLGVKKFVVGSMYWDDLLITLGLLCALARIICFVVNAEKFDLGYHTYDIPPQRIIQIADMQKNLLFIGDMLYLWGIMFTKLALLVFLLMIFQVRPYMRLACAVMMSIITVYCLLGFFLYAFACNPPGRNWHFIEYAMRPPVGSCIDITKVQFAIGGMNMVTDLILLIMPLPVVWQLQMGLKRKIALFCIFATGTFVWVSTIVREAIVVKTLRDADQTWSPIPEIIWLTVELCVGIICACLPTFGPIYNRGFFSKLVPSSVRSLLSFRRSSHSKLVSSDRTPGIHAESDVELGAVRSRAVAASHSRSSAGINHSGRGIAKQTDVDVSYEERIKPAERV